MPRPATMLARWLVVLACLVAGSAPGDDGSGRASLPGGTFETVVPPATGLKAATISAFRLDRMPVTNEEFARFVREHPEWARDRVARVFADAGYLTHWQSATSIDATIARRPVTRVSWFAASAYCESRGARLPRWYEWEFAAAASETKPDARQDPAWRQRILDWYSTSGRGALPEVGGSPPNFYGVRDLHGVVWEWVEDAGGLMASDDSREQGDPNLARFCGSGALTLEQKENYAMMMRIAMLSSMKAAYTSGTMGFRCATDAMP